MKATEAKLLDFLKKSPQFVIPIYQRTYSWTEPECRQLWDDLMRTGHDDNINAHFMGSVVYVEQGLYQVSSQSPLLVIDGQQRLTTMMLIIEALARALRDSEPIDGFSAKKLRSYYLTNPLEAGDRAYKLILSQDDKASLIALLNQQDLPHQHSLRIRNNFELIDDWVQNHCDDLSDLCKGLAKLIVVDISLNRDQDDPQLIFESLNSTGRELSQADLIRNFVLMGLEQPLQTKLYEQYWRPMEVEFGQEAYAALFDSFMRHYLTVKTGEIPNVRDVYTAFKAYAQSVKKNGFQSLVSDVRKYASYFCKLALGKEQDVALRTAFQDFRDLKVDPAFPFLLELYSDYDHGILNKSDFERAIRLIEAYVFRRAVCSIPTNSHNKTFTTFGRSLEKKRYLESILAHLTMLPSYRRFPSDEEFALEIASRDFYTFPRRSYAFRRLENEGRKEPISVDDYTIEHILPQNEKLSAPWKLALGAEWAQIQRRYLHTLGNLTLTGYNAEYSDKPFAEKRDMEGGFAQSPLRLNKGLGSLTTWNEESINERAIRLAGLAVNLWQSPKLEASVLETYAKSMLYVGYSISDHPQLADGPIRNLFEALRKEIVALDSCVSEEFLKVYIAYKAETNFVDVVPQTKRLRLILNMEFANIDDPQRRCKDITGIGRWGNGDVALDIANIEELPYALKLIRQSFEQQMGASEAVTAS